MATPAYIGGGFAILRVYNEIMIDRSNIRHAAMLKPEKTKCQSLTANGQHAYTKTEGGRRQCIDCGKTKK